MLTSGVYRPAIDIRDFHYLFNIEHRQAMIEKGNEEDKDLQFLKLTQSAVRLMPLAGRVTKTEARERIEGIDRMLHEYQEIIELVDTTLDHIGKSDRIIKTDISDPTKLVQRQTT